jgi:tetratricopeptide (TPR) repeat protein
MVDERDEAQVMEEVMDAHSKGDHDRAIELSSRLIEADADWAQPFYFRGASRLLKGEAEQALADLSRAIELDSDIPYFAYHDRGRALAALGRHEEALADFERAVALRPDKGSTRNRLGTSLYHLGRLDDAVAAYSEAIRLEPDQAEFHFDRGALYLNRGQFDEAIADFTRAIELEPDAHYYFSRAMVYMRQHDPERALADLDDAINRSPEVARAWYARGYVHFTTRRCNQGETDFARAVERDPSLAGWPYEQRWLAEQRSGVESYLRSHSLTEVRVPEEPAWDLAPYLALWQVGRRPRRWWVICGDCPTDHLPGGDANDARGALAAFGQRWRRAAENVLAGRADPEVEMPRERWPELGKMLRTRAEMLLEYAANEELWGIASEENG